MIDKSLTCLILLYFSTSYLCFLAFLWKSISLCLYFCQFIDD